MEGTQRHPWCTRSPGRDRLTCPSVQLPCSPTGVGRLMAGLQSCICLSLGHLNDPRLKGWSLSHRPQIGVYVMNVQSLGQHIPTRMVERWTLIIGCSILPSHSFGNTQLPSQPWVQQVVSVSESQAGLGNLCSVARSRWPDAPLQAGLWLCCMSGSGWAPARSGGQEAGPDDALVPGQVFLNLSFPISESQWPVSPTPVIEETVFSPPLCIAFNSAFKKSS